MTPRRSSRARTQPSPAVLQHSQSSSSTNSVTRAGERNTRWNHKFASPQRSATHRSQSIDDPDPTVKNDHPQTRQRQRARGDENDEILRLTSAEDEDDDAEEDEVTRCICGQQDYPGLPPSRRQNRIVIKDDAGLNPSTDVSDLLQDEIGSMFIQCDTCKVWQHGGCVGIMDEAMSPEEYFCEECRKDLHKITNESNGQNSSQYLPVAHVSTPTSSRASSRDNSGRSRDSKSHQNENQTNPKRRSTMNSRDAAYDEEEQLRRAIEESKEDTKGSNDDSTTRRPKRSRSDSDVTKQVTKRQRTNSPSPSSLSKQSHSISQLVSDDDQSKAKTGTNGGAKKQRGVIARNQREKEMKDGREVEEAEAECTEAANRRKTRPDRRRGDESDGEDSSPPKVAGNDPEPSDPTPGTPAQVQEPAVSRPVTRKTGRPPARRGGRLGRNQYTRDRDTVNGNGSETNPSPNSPHGQSRDPGASRDSPNGSGHGGPNGIHMNGGEPGRPNKPRHLNNRTSMNEMKRRVGAILEFISRMQVEMAVSAESSSTLPNDNGVSKTTLVKGAEEQLGVLSQATTHERGLLTTPPAPSDGSVSTTDGEGGVERLGKEKDFKELSSVEMMDVLTRHLLKWQQEYGKYGDKP